MRWVLLLSALSACGGGADPLPPLMDTGWFTDTGSIVDAYGCAHKIGGFDPQGGTDWYHRTPPSLWVTMANPDAYSVSLVDEDEVPAPVTPTWSEDQLKLTLTLDEPLRPDTHYTLRATDCGAQHEVGFKTSTLGLPLTVDPSELVGKTWLMDMINANWVEPGGAEALVQLYFSDPTLLSVQRVDGDLIELMGAAGETDLIGDLVQAPGATWDFPTATFAEAPYFASASGLVVLKFQGVGIPIHGAVLAGTFAPDGSAIGGATLEGLGDTSGLGEFLGAGFEDDPYAVCDLAAGLGISCEPCPESGDATCLRMSAQELTGELVEGLVLTPQAS